MASPFALSRAADPAVFGLKPNRQTLPTAVGGTGGVNSTSSTDMWQLSQNPRYGSLMIWARASNSQTATGGIIEGGGVFSWNEIANFRHGAISGSTETGVQIGFVGAAQCSGFRMTGTNTAGAHRTAELYNYNDWAGAVEAETAPLTRTTTGTLTATLFGRRPGLLLLVATDTSVLPSLTSSSQELLVATSTTGTRCVIVWYGMYQANTPFSAVVTYGSTRGGLYAAVIT